MFNADKNFFYLGGGGSRRNLYISKALVPTYQTKRCHSSEDNGMTPREKYILLYQ